MLAAQLLVALLAVVVNGRPQSATSGMTAITSIPTSASLSTLSNYSETVPTGTYKSYSSQIILTSNQSSVVSTSAASSVSQILSGTISRTSTANGTATSSASTPMNTQKCNNYVEFCNRQYMNVTEVCAHNSAFSVKNNVASNQMYDITAQLNDGVRMIQGETHWYNDSIFSCHSSCDLLNAGTLQNELSTVAAWVEQHPYDVVTILLVNSDYRNVTDYIDPIQNSGLSPYLYEPPKIPMHRTDWPTYAEMIISTKRVVIFMDYNADQLQVPYILDEFSQMWETPFSPTDPSFPCTQQRPPGLSEADARDMPYLANHNLNLPISFGSLEILVPAYTNLSIENAVSGTNVSAGVMMDSCTDMWGRPPSWLLVDYYNFGDWPGSGRSENNSGSVFEVAAMYNGVQYDRACCGNDDSVSGASAGIVMPGRALLLGIVAAAGFAALF